MQICRPSLSSSANADDLVRRDISVHHLRGLLDALPSRSMTAVEMASDRPGIDRCFQGNARLNIRLRSPCSRCFRSSTSRVAHMQPGSFVRTMTTSLRSRSQPSRWTTVQSHKRPPVSSLSCHTSLTAGRPPLASSTILLRRQACAIRELQPPLAA